MNAFHPSGRPLGLPEDGLPFALAVARQGGRAGFASRSSRYSSYDDEEEPREERARRPARNVGTSWLIAAFVVAVGVVIVLIVAHQTSKENVLSFDEFQNRISAMMGGQRVFPVMSQKEYVERVGLPIRNTEYDDANFVYMSYQVKEGVVQVALDKPAWKKYTARIVRIVLE